VHLSHLTLSSLARNLYTSNARLVFELLQNADDNHFREARRNGEIPHCYFDVHPDKIVVTMNEDGFTPENLVAICNVGKSSKKGAQGYIGEKGIGFKSVFMAAYKACIQSGDFSFYFQHRPGDPGMGMISPIWDDSAGAIEKHTTRITLWLHTEGDKEVLRKQKASIRTQFQDLQPEILLFMKNIQEIRVTFHDDVQRKSTYKIQNLNEKRVKVTKTDRYFGKSSEDAKYYHLTKFEATCLAKNENRTYSAEEEASQAYSRSTVVLAFPMTQDSVPVVSNQWVFAFLPIRILGFKVPNTYD
jgi:hypothetical protein